MATTKPPVMTKEMKEAISKLSYEQLESIGLMRIHSSTEPPSMYIFPEVQAAAAWWANQLRGPVFQDNGDAMQSIIATVCNSGEISITEYDVTRFERCLAYCIQQRIMNKQWPGQSDEPSWRPDQPDWGSACRGIYNDYGPDAILVVAARLAGIPGNLNSRFPIKTNMRIDPGKVRVRAGYRGQEEVIYPPKQP